MISEDGSASKELIKLLLTKNVEMLNDGTVEDYNYFRDCLVYRLQYIDECFNIVQSSSIYEHTNNEYMLFPKVINEIPLTTNVGLFVFSMVCIFTQFYKLCFHSHCTIRHFQLRKIISSRGDISKSNHYEKIFAAAPKIILKGQVFDFSDTSKHLPAEFKDTPESERIIGPALLEGVINLESNERNFKLDTFPVLARYEHVNPITVTYQGFNQENLETERQGLQNNRPTEMIEIREIPIASDQIEIVVKWKRSIAYN